MWRFIASGQYEIVDWNEYSRLRKEFIYIEELFLSRHYYLTRILQIENLNGA